MMNKKEKLICCICGSECENNYGNNPYPLSTSGKCCNTCNIKVVESRQMMSKIKVGTRIVLDKDMNDPQPILKGEMGSVDFVDDIGQIHMKWDNGRTLALIFGVDEFHIVSD